MSGQFDSSCMRLLRLLEKSGISHSEICELVDHLNQEDVTTKAGHSNLLRLLQSTTTPNSRTADASLTAMTTWSEQSGFYERPNLDLKNVPALSQIDSSKYRNLHNQAFNISSLGSAISAEMQPATEETGNRRRFRQCIARISRIGHHVFTSDSIHSSDHQFLIRVFIEVPGAVRSAMLLLDTGSDYNVLGRQVANLLRSNKNSDLPIRLANTAGGFLNTCGKVTARWWCEEKQFSKRFESTEFHVSADELPVDAILGWEEIVKLGLLSLNVHKFVGFTSRRPRVDYATAALDQVTADARRQAEENEMRRDEVRRAYERQRRQHAHDQAVRYASAFAAQYQSRHGQEGLQQAYNAKYKEVFWQIYNNFAPSTT